MMMAIRLAALAVMAVSLAACSEGLMTERSSVTRGNDVPIAQTPSSFSEAGGIVIPSDKPDAEAKAFAARCGGGGGGSVRMGMSECDLIGIKGTPSRVISGLDQNGVSHNAVWYIEGGRRVVYKFDNDRLIDIIR
jgi:hypothetical protein